MGAWRILTCQPREEYFEMVKKVKEDRDAARDVGKAEAFLACFPPVTSSVSLLWL